MVNPAVWELFDVLRSAWNFSQDGKRKHPKCDARTSHCSGCRRETILPGIDWLIAVTEISVELSVKLQADGGIGVSREVLHHQ